MTDEIRMTPTNPVAACPHCGHKNDCASSLEGKVPRPGDVSVCFRCVGVGLFTEDLTVRVLTFQEEEELAQDLDLAQLVQALKTARGLA